ncbi:MAG: endonuclease [Acidobacteria bacterium]|nr:endonuclease [Acidobacteriota bacterium]
MRRSLIIVLTLLLLPATTWAWGGDGHRITAAFAFSRLKPATQQAVLDLLGKRGKRCGNPGDKKTPCAPESIVTLADAAPLPDSFRSEEGGAVGGEWHFVNIENSNPAFDAKRDCAFDDCVVGRIDRLKALLGDGSKSDAMRADALIYLTHFIGDIHQPFHCTQRTIAGQSDNGGNRVEVTLAADVDVPESWKSDANLHGVWDSTIIARTKLSVDAYVKRLTSMMAGRDPVAVAGSLSTVDWANESHQIAAQEYVDNGSTLDKAYFDQAQNEVDKRLLSGGLRLAAALEAALGAR